MGLHPDDGRRRPDRGHRGRGAVGQLRRGPARASTSRCSTPAHDGLVAHECILDLRALTKETGVTVDDVAKRLIDYGFHAPTMSFPVAGTLMVEPTESEDLARARPVLRRDDRDPRRDRAGRGAGSGPPSDNPLRNAPHTARRAGRGVGPPLPPRARRCSRPASTRDKYWPPVARIDQAYGDRNLVCSCPPPEAFAD